MKGPTFQLLLDFAKNSVWPFVNFIDHQVMSKLVIDLRLGVEEELGEERLRLIMSEFYQRRHTQNVPQKVVEEFPPLITDIYKRYGDTLTKDALTELRRDKLAPMRPRNTITV